MSILTIKEWPISTAGGPIGLAVDAKDQVYFSGGPGRFIGRLDPFSNTLSTWKLPSWSKGPWALAVAVDDSLFFNEFVNYICRFDPKSGELTRWDLSAFSLNVFEIALQRTRLLRQVWCTLSGYQVGRLNLGNGRFDVFNTAPSALQALAVDKGGMVWMGSQYEIMRLNPLTRKLVRYVNYPFPAYVFPPGGPAPNAFIFNFGLKVGSKGRILYAGSSTNYVGWLDPRQSTVTEFLVPTPMALPLGMASSSDFWFTEAFGNNISILEAPPGAASRPVTATTWTIPRSTGTAPVTRFQLRQRDNVVAPQTGVTVGTVTGPFEEFPLPTPDSRPLDIAVGKTGVFFTEQLMPPPPLSGSLPVGGNKIGLLQP